MIILCGKTVGASPFEVDQAGPVPVPEPVAKPQPAIPLEDIIMNQIARCWVPPQTENSAQMPPVVLDASLDRKGNVVAIALNKESKADFQKKPAFRKIAFAAILAVKQCSPFHDLPEFEYAKWKQLQLKLESKPMPSP